MKTAVAIKNESLISFENMTLSSQVSEVASDYVFYTGGIAGISDVSGSEGNPKSFNGRSDEVEFDRNGVNRV